MCVLTDKSGMQPDWNFWKYLVDHNGKVVDAWGPWMDPDRLYNIISQTISKAEKAAAANGTKSHGGEL